tara:strand:+ start:3646 stop:3951 length:306 start_codon:yes stop_codon:yes gene_type:complete
VKLKDILKSILSEIEYKIVVRGGKKVKKVICKPGMKYVPAKKRCVVVKGAEKRKKAKASKIAAKKRGKKMAQILKKRAKAMKKRAAMGLDRPTASSGGGTE